MSLPEKAPTETTHALNMPGDNHRAMQSMIGEWDYVVTTWAEPGAEEQTHQGVMVNDWVLGGRFVRHHATATLEVDGKPVAYEGYGMMGYDNGQDTFTGMWVDNTSTGILLAHSGSYDPQTNTITEFGDFTDQTSGKKVKFKGEIAFVDENHYTFTMYILTNPEQSFKSTVIKYTRKK